MGVDKTHQLQHKTIAPSPRENSPDATPCIPETPSQAQDGSGTGLQCLAHGAQQWRKGV